jgi:hypothetical protein
MRISQIHAPSSGSGPAASPSRTPVGPFRPRSAEAARGRGGRRRQARAGGRCARHGASGPAARAAGSTGRPSARFRSSAADCGTWTGRRRGRSPSRASRERADPEDERRRRDKQRDPRNHLPPHRQHRGDGRGHHPEAPGDQRRAHLAARTGPASCASRSGSPFAQAEIVPAPRQTTMSPGWLCSRTSRSRSSSSRIARAWRWPWRISPGPDRRATRPGSGPRRPNRPRRCPPRRRR